VLQVLQFASQKAAAKQAEKETKAAGVPMPGRSDYMRLITHQDLIKQDNPAIHYSIEKLIG
jgi:hypothetical protein